MTTQTEDDPTMRVALFRYGVIADLLHDDERDEHTLADKLRSRAGKTHTIPGSRRSRVAEQTMRDWLRAYRHGGIDALRPKVRRDAGSTRTLPIEIADALCEIKEEHRDWTVVQVIKHVRAQPTVPADIDLPLSTVHRLLAKRGLMERGPAVPTDNDRRRFSFEKAGQLWMSDVMHGPAVLVEGRKKRKAYLLATIDDATRVIPFAAFALAENTSAFLPVLRQAILRRGVPQRLYVDNGATYRSHHLALVCARLGITLIHSRPYMPQGRGKIERFFRTVRMQLMAMLLSEDLRSLDAINRRLWGWIEGEYHQAPHKGLDGQTPLDRWGAASDEVRMLDHDVQVVELFLLDAKRRVQKDRTVSLRGVVYEVDAALVGETVTLRYDPSRTNHIVQVLHRGKRMTPGRVLDAYANCFVKRNHATKMLDADGAVPPPPPSGVQLHQLRDDENRRDR